MMTKVQTTVTFGEGSDGKGQGGASGLLRVHRAVSLVKTGHALHLGSMNLMCVFYNSIKRIEESGFCSVWPTLLLILTLSRERLCLTNLSVFCNFHLESLIPLRQLFPL